MDTDTLVNRNLMLLGEGHCLTDHALSVCHLDKNKIKSSFSDASLNTLIQMALSGMGTTLIPEMAVAQIKQQNPDIAAIPLAEPGPHRKLAFITRLNYARVDDVSLLGNAFAEALDQSQ